MTNWLEVARSGQGERADGRSASVFVGLERGGAGMRKYTARMPEITHAPVADSLTNWLLSHFCGMRSWAGKFRRQYFSFAMEDLR